MKSITHNEFQSKLQANPLKNILQDQTYIIPLKQKQSLLNIKKIIQQKKNQFIDSNIDDQVKQNKMKKLFECVEQDQEVEKQMTHVENDEDQEVFDQEQEEQLQIQQCFDQKQNQNLNQKKGKEKEKEKGKNIFDFIQEQQNEEQKVQTKDVQESISSSLASDKQNYVIQALFKPNIRFYPSSQMQLMRHTLSQKTFITFSVLNFKKPNSSMIYSLRLYDQEVCRCISLNNKFVFECSDGAIAQMFKQNRTYSMNTLNNNDSQRTNGTIRMKSKNIAYRSYIGIQTQFQTISSKSTPKILQYNSKDPSVNQKGKFQLNIADNTKIFKASFNNFLLLDIMQNQVCRVLKSQQRQITVYQNFSPLLAFVVAVAKMDWTKQKQ